MQGHIAVCVSEAERIHLTYIPLLNDRVSNPPKMPAGVETSLQQLDLAAGADANSAPAASGTQQEQPVTHDQHEQEQQETPAALHNTACLAATFSLLESEQSLLQCSAVCRLWQSVLEADDIWRRVYLRHLPEPLLHERVSRWVGRVAATDGTVLWCYNTLLVPRPPGKRASS